MGGVRLAGSWMVGVIGGSPQVEFGGCHRRWWRSMPKVVVMGGGKRLRGEREQCVKSEEEGGEGK
jgi:hypothetical protein